MRRTSGHSEGFALASALLIVLLLAGFSIGAIYQVNLETRLVATDLENNQAHYARHHEPGFPADPHARLIPSTPVDHRVNGSKNMITHSFN